jgi:hypothetical protein
MDKFEKGDVVYYDFKQVVNDDHPGIFCVVRGIQTYKNITDHILLVYEDEADKDEITFRFVANPDHLIKVDPNTPQNRLAIQIKYA